MRKYPDLTGRRFGMWLVLAPAPSSADGRRRWLCRCDCGKESVVLSSNLTSGHSKGCGCIKEKDLTGQHIGRLTVLSRSERFGSRGKRKTRLWECRCDCGEICYKATDTLTNPDISMCRRCAEKYAVERARAGAGYVEGTQLARITNPKPDSDNISGIRGVYYERKTGKYRARLEFRGKSYSFGSYDTAEEASAARRYGEFRIFGEFLEEFEAQKRTDGDPE